MDDSLMVVASYGTILVTIVLFLVGWRRRERQARDRVRGAAVQSMIDAISATAKRMNRPGIVRPFYLPETDFSIALLNLAHSLDKRDEAIAAWAARQSLEMRNASSDQEALALGVRAAGRLSEWSKGSVDRTWFESEIRRSGDVSGPGRSMRRLVSRTGEQLWGWSLLLGTATVVVMLGARASSRQR